ncbi:WecB/TagA/CpsF family glycosyltransferase [Fontisphaera persica]|uniref:WecB/TagA/CpsF family glycosyltransferase n=1 Tax=Fontisphaera persica TaxID=2974023 RepID=UPI0024BF4D94|nr:WecB/TagA/CpsF family glycosyltransferase [Fontisphaera persica]WCJ58821.1 WecB/TagA/CpsF family glycosyltransferase [Fontisphaera persica]
MDIARYNVLGVQLSALNPALARQAILEAVASRRKGYVCVTGVHGVMESQEDPALRDIHNRAFLCTPDGMPMVWLGRRRGHPHVRRVYGPDLMLDLLAVPGLRHFFYGGAPGVTTLLRQRLEARFPGLQIVGAYEPPFRPLTAQELAALARQVAAARPDIMWIGLSTPKQERFMAAHIDLLETTLMIGVGAAFDFHAGRVPQAPRWMQRAGLEWLYRLCREPRRLGPRYLKNNPRFVYYLLLESLGLRRPA